MNKLTLFLLALLFLSSCCKEDIAPVEEEETIEEPQLFTIRALNDTWRFQLTESEWVNETSPNGDFDRSAKIKGTHEDYIAEFDIFHRREGNSTRWRFRLVITPSGSTSPAIISGSANFVDDPWRFEDEDGKTIRFITGESGEAEEIDAKISSGRSAGDYYHFKADLKLTNS